MGARRWCRSLPWSEILPYKSIRVNLTEAVMKGWALKGIEDFPAMLQCKSVRYVCDLAPVCL